MIQVSETRVGEPRPPHVALPPISMLLHGYVFAYDTRAKAPLYVCGPGYGGVGERWTFDGDRAVPHHEATHAISGRGEYVGTFDASRDGVVFAKFTYQDGKNVLALGISTQDGASELPVTGEVPSYDERPAQPLIAYDQKRDVLVVLMADGVWELSSDSVFTKKSDRPSALVSAKFREFSRAVWNPVSARVFFAVFCGSEYRFEFYEWDGETFGAIPTGDLPLDKDGDVSSFHFGLFQGSALFASHRDFGVLLIDGPHRYACDGETFLEMASPNPPPPRMHGGHMVYDEEHNRLWIGPGFHDGDAGGRDAQRVYFTSDDGGGSFTQLGAAQEDSPLEKAYNRRHFASFGGEDYAVASSCLHTFVWRDEAWTELVDDKEEVSDNEWVEGLVEQSDGLLAILRNGVVCRFDGTKWTAGETIPDFKERMFPCVAKLSASNDLIVWGGEVKGRKSNDTFLFVDGAWSKVKKSSPRPSDFAHGRKDDVYVRFTLFYDEGLKTVVRLGFDEVATWNGKQWEAHVPDGYADLLGARAWHHVPVSDPKTGETLLVNIDTGVVARFDLAVCTQVGAFEQPSDLEPLEPSEWFSRLHEDVFVRDARLRALFVKDKWANYEWELSACFAAAQALGPRTECAALVTSKTPPKSKAKSATKKAKSKAKGKAKSKAKAEPKSEPAEGFEPVRLYVIDDKSRKFWHADVEADEVVTRWGKIGGKVSEKRESKKAPNAHANKLAQKKRGKGYVDGEKLKPMQVAPLATTKSAWLNVGKASSRAPKDLATSRIGGSPSGVTLKKWPKREKERLGFLCQIKTDHFAKYAAVSVFCPTDGTATEEEETQVVLLTEAMLETAPIDTPEGVEALRHHSLKSLKPKLEINEDAVAKLASLDNTFADLFDTLADSSKVSSGSGSKTGGYAEWLQQPEYENDEVVLLAQLDFDSIVLKGWEGAGLHGMLYVFAPKKGNKVFALWQYT